MCAAARLDGGGGGPDDPGVRTIIPPGLQGLLRSSFVLVGVLLLGVGLADMAAGMVKVSEYRAVLASELPAVRREPDTLFPTATEAEQRRAVAQAKLGYYELLVVVGQLFAAAGVVLVAVGAVRARLGTLREASAAP